MGSNNEQKARKFQRKMKDLLPRWLIGNEWGETSREKENWIIKMSRKGVIILMSLYDVS